VERASLERHAPVASRAPELRPNAAIAPRSAAPEPLRPVVRDKSAAPEPLRPVVRDAGQGRTLAAGAPRAVSSTAPPAPEPLEAALQAAFAWVSAKPIAQAPVREALPARPAPARAALAAPEPPRPPPREQRALHIGSIEVRIQPTASEAAAPPPVTPVTPAPQGSQAPASRPAIARGFITPLGLRQG
jgi:hypothetical protein